MRSCCFTKCIVAQINATASEPRPRDADPNKPFRKKVRLECAPVVDAVVFVNVCDELILNKVPMPLQQPKRRGIDRYAVPVRRFSGAGNRRRDAEPCGPLAGAMATSVSTAKPETRGPPPRR
jgi:hypothetical protein